MENFILTDYIFAFIVITSTLFGFARGMLRESFTILNVVLASYAAYFSYGYGAEFLGAYIEDATTLAAATSLCLFVFWWVVIAVINSFVLDMLAPFKGGFIDRILGMAFGVLRGALVVIGIYIGASIVSSAQTDDEKLPAWLKDAGTLNYVKMQSQNFLEVAPSEYAEFYYQTDESKLNKIIGGFVNHKSIQKATAEKFVELGFDAKQIEALVEIYSSTPNAKLSLNEIVQQDNEVIGIYGEQIISEYKNKIASGEVQNGLTSERINDLRNAFDNVKFK